MRAIVVVVSMVLASQSAAAEPDRCAEGASCRGPLVGEPFSLELELDSELATMRKRPSLGKQVKTKLSLWGNELGAHLNLLTLDLFDLELDVDQRHANLRLGALTRQLGLLVAGDIQMRGDVARVNTRLTLGLRERTLELDLPTVEIASQSVKGERSVELRIPLIEGSF